MTQHLIKLVGGPFTGSRVPMPPPEMLHEGRILRMRGGDRYQLEWIDRIGAQPVWEAHWIKPELDPLPWYVAEASDDNNPATDSGRYSYEAVANDYNEYDGRAGTLAALAKWWPRPQYTQEQEAYR